MTSDLAADYRARFGVEASADLRLDLPEEAAATLSRIISRRSYRKFAQTPVEEGLREALLACAQSASAKSDLQQYSILDIREPAAKTALAELCDTGWMADAPVLLVYCGDLYRARGIGEQRGHVNAQDTLDSFFNAAVDAALAMQSYILAAEAAGLGCCCVSQVRKRLPETSALLGLPDGVFPVAGLGAGWPGEPRDVSLRLPPSVVVHRDAYDAGVLSANIDGYDKRRHAARPIPAQFKPETYGEAAFYGWSENQSRRLAEPSDLGGLRAFLESHGFKLG